MSFHHDAEDIEGAVVDLRRLRAEKAELIGALKDAHEAIEALIHSEQNPHSYRIENKAGDAVMKARQSKRAILSRDRAESTGTDHG